MLSKSNPILQHLVLQICLFIYSYVILHLNMICTLSLASTVTENIWYHHSGMNIQVIIYFQSSIIQDLFQAARQLNVIYIPTVICHLLSARAPFLARG